MSQRIYYKLFQGTKAMRMNQRNPARYILNETAQSLTENVTMPPGTELGVETHNDRDQHFWVLSGHGTFIVWDHGRNRPAKRLTAWPGTVMIVNKGTQHNVVASSSTSEPFCFITVYSY